MIDTTYNTHTHITVYIIIYTEGNNKEETYLIERLFSSSLVAIVTQSQKRKLKLYHFKVRVYFKYLFSSCVMSLFRKQQKYVVIITQICTILALKLNRQVSEQVYFESISWPMQRQLIFDKYLTECQRK